MPVIPATGSSVSGQITQTSQASTTQSNMRQMIGIVQQWNPDCPVMMIQEFIKSSYRRVIDARTWAGLQVRGQIVVPNVYSTGTVTVAAGSPIVTGIGTTFTAAMVGMQFRIGFGSSIYTILSFESATQVTLSLDWGDAAYTSAGFSIFQQIVTPGSNVKFLFEMVNQRQGYRLNINIPQEALNRFDAWRTQTGWTWMAANYPMSAAGAPQYELYPIPTSQQTFPFLAYVQPPDLTSDLSYPAAFIRSDIINYGAIAQVLVFRGKNSKYYDPNVALQFEGKFQAELQKMMMTDDNLISRDLTYDYSKAPFSQFGADYGQNHDI